MQTLSVQIQDDYMKQFMDFVKDSHSNIIVSKDKNIEIDPYFYERKKDLEQNIEESENGKMEMLSQEQYDQEMEIFFKDLKANANL
ncbi:MAG: hypothetical protein WC141_04035 [Arcobacteraceae bacterium]